MSDQHSSPAGDEPSGGGQTLARVSSDEQAGPLQSSKGATKVADAVVTKVAGIEKGRRCP